ncbi:MAG: PKD domain-containing protein [Limisphaerales bacterium]
MNMGFSGRFAPLWLAVAFLGIFQGQAKATISISPAVQTICQGDVAELTVNVPEGLVATSFRWHGPNVSSTSNVAVVASAGNYRVEVFDENGNYSTACATVHLKERPSIAVGGGYLNCVHPETLIFAQTSASNAVFNWSGPGIVSGGDTATATVNEAGIYTVTVTAMNGCSTSKQVEVIRNTALPQLSVSIPAPLTCQRKEVVLTASSTNTSVLFHWSGPGIVGSSNLSTCVVNQPGVYMVTATSIPGAIGMLANGTSPFIGAGFVSGGTNPFETNYYSVYTNRINTNRTVTEWLGESVIGGHGGIIYCDNETQAKIIDQNGVERPFNEHPIPLHLILSSQLQFHYSQFLSYSYTLGSGCPNTATVVVLQETFEPPQSIASESIGNQFVSFGQGFWANGKGKLNGVRSADLLKLLLIDPTDQSSSPIVVGKPGRSLSIPLAAAEWLHTRLPAIGASAPLPSFGDQMLSAATGQTSPAIPAHKKGNFQNELLGHVISLALNLRLDESLADFDLALEFCTAGTLPGPDKLVGTADDLLDTLGQDGIPNSGDETKRFSLPSSVFHALCEFGLPRNPAGLLELGNRALAGHTPHPATYDQLARAIEAINAAFDGARISVVCE